MNIISKLGMAGLAVILLAGGAAQAAAYTNADVTSTTLNEADAYNSYVSYDVSESSTILVGGVSGSDNVTLVVDDSEVTTTGYFHIGANSRWNGDKGGSGGNNASVIVQNGGAIRATGAAGYAYSWVGATGTENASLLVTGANSKFIYNVARMAMSGTDGTITVEDGGMLVTDLVYLNRENVGSGNMVRVNGGYLCFGSNNFAASGVEVYDGSDWVVASTLTDEQKAALGFTYTTYTAAEFEATFGESAVSGRDNMYVYTSNYVPEPATLSLLALSGLAAIRRRMRK